MDSRYRENTERLCRFSLHEERRDHLSTKRNRNNRENREGLFSFSLHKACQTLKQDGLAIFDSLLDLYRENKDKSTLLSFHREEKDPVYAVSL